MKAPGMNVVYTIKDGKKFRTSYHYEPLGIKSCFVSFKNHICYRINKLVVMKKNIHLIVLLLLPFFLFAQEKPTLTPDDYGQWESFSTRRISPDGQWLAYVVRRVDKKNELRVRNLQTDSLKVIKYGTNPQFSDDSQWLTYRVTPSEEEKKSKDNKQELVKLESWDIQSFDKITTAQFDDSGNFLALKSKNEAKAKGSNVQVLDLNKGTQLSFGNVKTFSWAEKMPLIAMIMETADDAGNGLQLFNPQSGVLKTLDASKSKYSQLSWHDEKASLAVIKTMKEEDSPYSDKQHIVLSWTGLDGGQASMKTFDPTKNKNFPATARVSEYKKPLWAANGDALYLDLQPRLEKEKKDTSKAKKKEKISDVQVWHAKDVLIFPQQRSRYSRDSKRGLLAQWNLDNDHFMQIGQDAMQNIQILKNDQYVLEGDNQPYPYGRKFGRYYEDRYLTDLKSGERKKVIEKVRYNFGASPGGNYLLYFKGKDYWVYDIKKGTHTNITKDVNSNFANEAYDYPVKQYPPYFSAGWEKEDKSVLVYDEFDIWKITPDGKKATKLTNGAKDEIIYRYLRIDPEAKSIDLDKPVYCRMSGKKTKKTGYARIEPKGQVKELIYNSQRITGLMKAKSADTYVYMTQDFSTSPNLYATNANFDNPEKRTKLNHFQEKYAWGKAELVDYKSTTGRDLQGALFYPANYDPMKKYPMVVYTYEIVSNWVNRYFVPSEQSLYNFTTFTSEGYFVLAPDIVYEAREPGQSALASVEAAVKKVSEKGLIDPSKVGLVGHSWGGYQATYLPTQTDIFAASVAGAPITNFLSFMGAIHWNPGIPEVDHWETGQARMDVPYWEDLEAYLRNSPAASVHELKTPMLMAFGDSDGVVDWHQGVEFYNFARRAGNEDFVMLVYPGEDHGIAGEEHRKDYNQRIREWFNHYLKGQAAKDWIKEGVSFDKRERTLKKIKP